MTRHLVAAVALVLCGCQGWATIELAVPVGNEVQVRQVVQETSLSAGLLPCSEWGMGVKNADQCFGGKVGGDSVTVFTEFRTQAYAVKLHALSAGSYDKSELEALVHRYSAALEQLVPQRGVARTRTHELPEFCPESTGRRNTALLGRA
ncbi:MAG: hypothetical protein IPJ08_11465 [Burkholderiales bacterium]|nr:hypothetical protein [Burkholderiales bacterium]